MADGGQQSRYVKLTRDQAPVDEDITPGDLNQPIQVPQVHKLFLLLSNRPLSFLFLISCMLVYQMSFCSYKNFAVLFPKCEIVQLDPICVKLDCCG